MSRARHKARAKGGGLSSAPEWEAGGHSNAAKEAEEKKKGGRVHHHGEGEHAKHRADKRARGGKCHERAAGGTVARKHGGHVKHNDHDADDRARGGAVARKHGGHVSGNGPAEIHEVKHHSMKHHRGRARGGAIGADRAPLTTAAKVKHITPGEQPEHGLPGELESVSAHVIKG